MNKEAVGVRNQTVDQNKASELFIKYVAPYLKEKMGAVFTMGETDSGVFATDMDMKDCVDATIVLRDGRRFHAALRIQWLGSKDWGSITEREERVTTGQRTEHEKRERTLKTGEIMAHVGVHAYVDDRTGKVYGVYVYRIADLHDWIGKQGAIRKVWIDRAAMSDNVYLQQTNNDGRITRFYVVKAGPMELAGYKMKRYSETSDELTALMDKSGIWKKPIQKDLFPGLAVM